MPFDPIARFYDLDDGRLAADIPLYLGFARQSGGPILDLGVGSARLALPLASSGYLVTGLDISHAMLAIGRGRIADAGLEEYIQLIQADFRTPPLASAHFALAYCGYNAFLHLIESHEQLATLRAWRRLLRPGGLLLLDVENPQLEALAVLTGELEFEEALSGPDAAAPIKKFTAAWADLPDQILYLRRLYHQAGQDYEATFQVRILFQRELALLLHCADFSRLRFYGNYDLSPWEPDSPRLIAVAGA